MSTKKSDGEKAIDLFFSVFTLPVVIAVFFIVLCVGLCTGSITIPKGSPETNYVNPVH